MVWKFWQYKLVEELGNGTMGDMLVYLATERSTNKWACLKKVQLTDDNMIPVSVFREASLLYEMEHENVVRYILRPSMYLYVCCLILLEQFL